MRFTENTLRAFEKLMIAFMQDNNWVRFCFDTTSPYYTVVGLEEMSIVEDEDLQELCLIVKTRDARCMDLSDIFSSIYDYNRVWDEMIECAKLSV